MKISRNIAEKLAAALLLVAALALIGFGAWRIHKVYDPVTEEFGILAFQRISERELVGIHVRSVRRDKGLFTRLRPDAAAGQTGVPHVKLRHSRSWRPHTSMERKDFG